MSKQPSTGDGVIRKFSAAPETSVAEAGPAPETRAGTSTESEPEREEPGARVLPTRIARLVAQNVAPVWRVLRRLGVPEADVDDAMQQVFLVANGKLSDVRLESERPYLFAVAARVASHMRRGNRRREAATQRLRELARTEVPTPEQLAEERQQFTRALSRMPSDVRVVFMLFEMNAMSLDQVAEHLDVPRGTVVSRLRRARTIFRADAARDRSEEAPSVPTILRPRFDVDT